MFRFPPNSDCIGVDYCNTDIKYSCQRSLFYPKENYKQDLYYLLSICKSQHTMFQRLNPVCGDPLNLEKMKAEIPQDAPFLGGSTSLISVKKSLKPNIRLNDLRDSIIKLYCERGTPHSSLIKAFSTEVLPLRIKKFLLKLHI